MKASRFTEAQKAFVLKQGDPRGLVPRTRRVDDQPVEPLPPQRLDGLGCLSARVRPVTRCRSSVS